MITANIRTIFALDSACKAIQYLDEDYYSKMSEEHKDMLQGEDDYTENQYLIVNDDSVILSNPDDPEVYHLYSKQEFFDMTEEWLSFMDEENQTAQLLGLNYCAAQTNDEGRE